MANYEVALAMKADFHKIRQALEEHLTAINENTAEIQAVFDYMQELELKIEKLSQRMDQLQLKDRPQEKITIAPLNHMEKKIFLVLYTEEIGLTFQEIARRAEQPLSTVPECISSLVNKGIPLHRNHYDGRLFLRLDPAFKELQAKENIVNLSLQSFIV